MEGEEENGGVGGTSQNLNTETEGTEEEAEEGLEAALGIELEEDMDS